MHRQPQGLILALVSEKGGVGKSTLAATLTAHWHAQGLRVLGVDLDPQGTFVEWAQVAEENELDTAPIVKMEDNVRSSLPELADARDITIVDCPGRMGKRMMQALLLADLALVPVASGAPDIWALHPDHEKVETVKEVRPELKTAIVVNRKVRTRVARQTHEALASLEGVLVSDVVIHSRAALAEAFAAGSGVSVVEPGTVAGLEVRRLAQWLEDELGLDVLSQEMSNVA